MSVIGPIRPRKAFKFTGPRRVVGERMIERELNRRRKNSKQPGGSLMAAGSIFTDTYEDVYSAWQLVHFFTAPTTQTDTLNLGGDLSKFLYEDSTNGITFLRSGLVQISFNITLNPVYSAGSPNVLEMRVTLPATSVSIPTPAYFYGMSRQDIYAYSDRRNLAFAAMLFKVSKGDVFKVEVIDASVASVPGFKLEHRMISFVFFQ